MRPFFAATYVHVFVVWKFTRLESFFFNSIWWGPLSSNVFTICAVYWSLGRRGYFGVSNVVLVQYYSYMPKICFKNCRICMFSIELGSHIFVSVLIIYLRMTLTLCLVLKLLPHCQSPGLYQYILVNRLSSNGFWCPFLASFKFYRPQQNGSKANLRDVIAGTALVISNWIQIVNFSARVTVKFDGWPRKTIGHFFYNTSSFVHHFKFIGEFKLELQSGNAQSGSNSTIFRAVRPRNLTDDLAKQ